MDWGFTLLFVALVVGIISGVFIEKTCYKIDRIKESQGVLNVNCIDPEDGPYLFLELTVPVEDVIGKKSVTFEVNVIGLESHE